MLTVSRRVFMLGAPLALAGCASNGPVGMSMGAPDQMYAEVTGERFPVPRVDLSQIDPRFYRQRVSYSTSQPPGTIVVDTGAHFLYHVGADGTATRYGIGVGKDGFRWAGTAYIRNKQEWPSWTPPIEMQERDKEAAKYANGMPGGIDNPLGARAMYLFEGDRDTLYRLHGTIEPWSIGQSMSSGCIRLIDQDVIDLYAHTPVGTKVVVLPA